MNVIVLMQDETIALKEKHLSQIRDYLRAGKESNSVFKIKQLSIGRAGFLLGGGAGYLETQQRAG